MARLPPSFRVGPRQKNRAINASRCRMASLRLTSLFLLLPSALAVATTWQQATCPKSGRTYYYNPQTQESTWTKPAASAGGVQTFAKAPPARAQGSEASFEEFPLDLSDSEPATAPPSAAAPRGMSSRVAVLSSERKPTFNGPVVVAGTLLGVFGGLSLAAL